MALKEAKYILLILLVLVFLSAWFFPPLVLLCIAALLFVLWFFRDPQRPIPTEPGLVVSAADGKVVRVDETDEPYFTNKRMKRVAVFLSVFDVHVNRTPYEGTLVDTHHHAGDFLDARHPQADLKNEAMNWLIQTNQGNIVVRQIAGLIARRIIAWKTPGVSLARGERFGMIKFGSRTDVFLPLNAEILVKEGDRVQGGQTVIARFPPTNP
ncbi:MAG: phosphatidylserine decarboxylase family protein [Candidatus Methylacidiphilales bacterium]